MAFNVDQKAYKVLRSLVAERTSPVVVWCGSGLSAMAGLPTWQGMKSQLLDALRDKSATLSEDDSQKLLSRAKQISDQANSWTAFEMLRANLGRTTYQEVVREALRPAASVAVPHVYSCLWRLHVRGVLNLNLDRIATRAFYEVRNGITPVEFNARDAGRLTHVLKGARPFIANLHGVVDDVSTWVFTQSELRYLLSNAQYNNFIRSCISSNTVLFVGLSAEDIAVGGHLEVLTQLGVETGPHYWVTNRDSIELDRWAESIGIRVIRYSSPDDDHQELCEMFDDLVAFVPEEDTSLAPPVAPIQASTLRVELPSPDRIVREDAETIRQYLNARAKELLSKPPPFLDYDRFYEEYEEAIHRAWYTSTKPGSNALLGYRLDEEVAQGAFGRVYRASDSEGNDLAIKVLLIDIRQEHNLLYSFRRGVRTMRILSRHKIEGMVPYQDAFEIPAFAVMKWVEGPDLGLAIEARYVESWADLLRIASDLARIIREAHSLPERVLHRDIRPSNIMLEGFYTEPTAWRVVVLDFDLSWHRGATEKSVTWGSTKWGYLAPEQIQELKGVSTRHAAVDSFGMGMTLYFMLSRKDPLPDQHRHKDWEQQVRHLARIKPCKEWQSLPTRYARLIIHSTWHEQAKRLDVAQIKDEIDRLKSAILKPEDVESAELIAEELASRTEFLSGYVWNPDQACAAVDLPTGLKISLRGDEALGRLVLQLAWDFTGIHRWKDVWRWVPEAAQRTRDKLESRRWLVEACDIDLRGKSIRIRAARSAKEVLLSLDEASKSLQDALTELRF